MTSAPSLLLGGQYRIADLLGSATIAAQLWSEGIVLRASEANARAQCGPLFHGICSTLDVHCTNDSQLLSMCSQLCARRAFILELANTVTHAHSHMYTELQQPLYPRQPANPPGYELVWRDQAIAIDVNDFPEALDFFLLNATRRVANECDTSHRLGYQCKYILVMVVA